MSRITNLSIIIILILILCGCRYDIMETQVNGDYIDNIVREGLNEDFDTEYKSLDQALEDQIALYNEYNTNDNLLRVCRVLSEMSPRSEYYNLIVKYYGLLLDTMTQDKIFFTDVNSELHYINQYIENYLFALYESNMYDKFRYVMSNLELYIDDPQEIIKTAATGVSIIDSNHGSTEDYILLKEVLFKCEQMYADRVDTIFQAIIAKQIAICAAKTGDIELAEEYTKKGDSLLES